jgi:hypothetical protein
MRLTFSTVPLTLELHYVNLYMHDFAMNLHHDCKGKSISHAQEGDDETHPTSLTPAHQAALRVCLASVHGVLNTFLAFSPQEVRTIPNSAFARVAYASILLIKMRLAASLPESELGKLIPGDEMNVGRYIAGLIDLLRAGAANGKSRPAHNFSLVMAMLQVWYEKQINDRASFSNTVMKGEPKPKLQNGEVQSNPTAPAQREHQQSHGPSAMGQTPLHLLSEVAMGNSGPSGHQVPNGGDGTYDFSPAQANSTNAYKADMYPPSMIGDGLRRMHPGFEQALGMTLSGGDLNVLEDDGFFDLMQKTSNMFESNEG